MKKSTRTPTRDEKKLWRTVTRHDKKLKASNEDDSDSDSEEPSAPAVEEPRMLPAQAVRKTSAKLPPAALERGNYAGIDKRTAERFKRGDKKPDGKLDLHGMTSAEAHIALMRFVAHHVARGSRTLLIVTGKGKPRGEGVLWRALPGWLSASPLREVILTYDYATPRDGGEGATYILLKRKRV